MRAGAALRIVCIGLLQEGQRLVFGVAKRHPAGYSGRRAWLDRNGGHRRVGDGKLLFCPRAGCKTGAARTLQITLACYGVGTHNTEGRPAATAQSGEGAWRRVM